MTPPLYFNDPIKDILQQSLWPNIKRNGQTVLPCAETSCFQRFDHGTLVHQSEVHGFESDKGNNAGMPKTTSSRKHSAWKGTKVKTKTKR